jgi:large subunit ribosomal protein L9
MEIILKEDIIGLGYKNDILNVKSGYGRNYLIPTGKAIIASEFCKENACRGFEAAGTQDCSYQG